MARFTLNPFCVPEPDWSAPELAYTEAIRRGDQLPLHRALPGYAPTPLRELPRTPGACPECRIPAGRRSYLHELPPI